MSKKENLLKIEDCYEESSILSNWEIEFLDSIKKQLLNSSDNVDLTIRQLKCLNRIHEKCIDHYNKFCRR